MLFIIKQYCNMKYRITERQIRKAVEESTIKIIKEGMEDESLGGALGGLFGGAFRRTKQGLKDFGQGFRDSYNKTNVANPNTDNDTTPKTDQPSSTDTSVESENKDKIIQKLRAENQKLKQQLDNMKYGNMSNDDYSDSSMLVGDNRPKPHKKYGITEPFKGWDGNYLRESRKIKISEERLKKLVTECVKNKIKSFLKEEKTEGCHVMQYTHHTEGLNS